MRGYFIRQPWAFAGDKNVIPLPSQSSGAVSWNTGWGADYQKDQATDPSAKPVGRGDMNGVLANITEILRYFQTESHPEWISTTDNGGAPFPYDKGVIVRYRANESSAFNTYMSAVTNNISTPGANANWVDITTAITGALLKSGGVMTGLVNLYNDSTVPTPSTADNSLKLINSAWLKSGMSQSAGANGFVRLPAVLGGWLVQWGTVTIPASGTTAVVQNVLFPLSFGSIVGSVQVTAYTPVNSPAGFGPITSAQNISLSGFTIGADSNNGQPFNITQRLSYFAIGF